MTAGNINLQPHYWDHVWEREGVSTWRWYPGCFGRICWVVGHMQEVLELGCGVGVLARKLAEFGNSVTGLDISAAAIAQLSTHIPGVVSVLPAIPFPDSQFDVVVATEVLEHLDDDRACVAEVARVLRPGGRAYFAVPNNCLGTEDEPEHVRAYTPETLETLLTPYGYVFMETCVDEFISSKEDILIIPTILAVLYLPN